MKRTDIIYCAATALFAALLSSSAALHAQEQRLAAATPSRTSASERTEKMADQDEAAKQAEEKRREVVQDAVDALRESQNAFTALEQGKKADALRSLANATGKLELVVSRDPSLALAPVDVSVRMVDIYTNVPAVEDAVKRAKGLLDDGMVQDARALISDLESAIIASITNLPLATYPDAIRAITPLIDAGKMDEAKRALQIALSTLVIVDAIAPLPPVRAEALLKDAEMLAEKSGRTDEENQRLSEHLAAARTQLELGEALGYGTKNAFMGLYRELDDVESKTSSGKSGKGFFDKIKTSLSRAFG